MIAAHGGVLVNRELKGKQRDEAERKASGLPGLTLSDWELCDLEMIATGAMSPLEGFMRRDDYESCLDNRVLGNGLPWTLPIVKTITEREKDSIKKGCEIVLKDSQDRPLALMEVEDIFPHDKEKHAWTIYGTDDPLHPGIQQVLQTEDWLIGGKIALFNRPKHDDFLKHRLDPSETREAVWHALVRKNYGCTHFIIGRDHAGANKPDRSSYYGTYDTQLIFDEFDPADIGIEIFRFEHTTFLIKNQAVW